MDLGDEWVIRARGIGVELIRITLCTCYNGCGFISWLVSAAWNVWQVHRWWPKMMPSCRSHRCIK